MVTRQLVDARPIQEQVVHDEQAVAPLHPTQLAGLLLMVSALQKSLIASASEATNWPKQGEQNEAE